MGLVRLIVFGFIGLSVIYVLLRMYSRSIRREKLENQWAEDNPQGGDPVERQTYIERGLAEYDSGVKPKLFVLVYVVPAILVIAIHLLTTYY